MLVGGFNTVLDFTLLFIFVHIGINKIPANFLSTGVAMIVSFFANKTFTFKDTSQAKKRQFILFVTVTIIGMWVVQPLVIWLASGVLDPHMANKSLELLIAKLIATGASLVTNYLGYSRVVFKKDAAKEIEK